MGSSRPARRAGRMPGDGGENEQTRAWRRPKAGRSNRPTPKSNARARRPRSQDGWGPIAMPLAARAICFAEDQPNHLAARGPESHTDSDFTRPASDGVGQDPVEADAGEQQRQHSEGGGQRHHEPLVAQRLLESVAQSWKYR